MAVVSPNREGRLSKIEEADAENGGPHQCEVCRNDIVEEEDEAMCEEISRLLIEEPNVVNSYNEFRNRKGLSQVDAGEVKNHRVIMCMDCLLECFQPRRVNEGDYELDEVSAYRGSLFQGIGLTKHGHYARKLGDEMNIPRKRAFANSMHGPSTEFQKCGLPANREIMHIEQRANELQLMNDARKKQVQQRMGQTFTAGMDLTETPAGSRVPKPFKKT